MDGQRAQRVVLTLDELLEAGREALAAGEKRAAHNLWRQAAVTNPYDERVWSSLMDVLVYDDDREVCLENIIAINPLNTEARRQLRALKRARGGSDDSDTEMATMPNGSARSLDSEVRRQQRALKRARREAGDSDTEITTLPIGVAHVTEDESELIPHEEGHSFGEAVVTGIGVGLIAIVLGIIFSIFVYGGILIRGVP